MARKGKMELSWAVSLRCAGDIHSNHKSNAGGRKVTSSAPTRPFLYGLHPLWNTLFPAFRLCTPVTLR